MIESIDKCRICGSEHLVSIIDLGEQVLTGVFPKSKDTVVPKGPLELVKCMPGGDGETCGLVQLRHSCDPNEMYGLNYGYRSSLNQSMVRHLNGIVQKNLCFVQIEKTDIVLDIGSNDGSLLRAYPKNGAIKVGIDPAGEKFRKYYSEDIQLISDFFSAASFQKTFGSRKAKIVTSIAMFYDLENPLDFMRQVWEILADDGIWVFEQSYLPAMLAQTAYDTICHEHIEYYCLKQIDWMARQVGFKIIDVERNPINGGSFAVRVAKSHSKRKPDTQSIAQLLAKERQDGYDTLVPFEDFRTRVRNHKAELSAFIEHINSKNHLILGYGASTKGNVILQYCGFTPKQVPYIAEVNEDKYGCFTPGTHIPIISETEAKAMAPDYFLVLPWHFKENFLKREHAFLKNGGGLIFPLPQIEIVKRGSISEN